ncbi:MAG: methylmalonyl-CoA mutase, partial [Candidatus Bathyarchaeia archaeon]
QYAGYGTAEETNQRYKYLLKQGQTGLSVAFDLPTQIGYDADHPLAYPEVGKVGVSVSSLRDMEVLFRDIPLDAISTSMTINATAAIMLAMYLTVAAGQRVAAENIAGTVQNDILKEYIARGTYIYPPQASMRLTADIMEYCTHHASRFHPISISGYHMREAGATATQELAFTLANGIAYAQELVNRGVSIDAFAPRLSFFFGCHNDFLEEIAKFRAARRLWASIMKETFHAKDPASMMLRFHTQTCGVTLVAQQPQVNVVRVVLQALAAVLGGTQSLHTNSFDEALALPSEEAVLLALRTQQVIAHESNVTATADALGGSFYMEALTNELQEKTEEYLKRIQDLGGAVAAVEKGYYQREIADSAYRYQREMEKKERIIVGVNEYVSEKEAPVKILRVNPESRRRQIDTLSKVRAERDESKARDALDQLRKAAEKSDVNLLPNILDAVKAHATTGEISDSLRGVFGEYKHPTMV